MERVLVLMSTYNGEKYLKEQIDSVLGQKNINVDLLIRDDMSKDNTINILEEYSKKYNNISTIRGNNLGACYSFFELINKAKTNYSYYAFCDQDDIWLEDKLITGIKKLSVKKDNKKPSLYYSGQILVDENLNEIYNHKITTKRSEFANYIFNQTAGCTLIFNKKLLVLLKEYLPKNIYGHDVWSYKLCFAFNGNIIADSEGRILYRQHGKNVVGMNNGLKGKIERAKKYVFLYSPSSYSRELLNGYSKNIEKEKLDFIKNVNNSNNSLKSRINLIFDKKIVFKSISLRMLFIIKILLKKI